MSNNFPKIHPRSVVVNDARLALTKAIGECTALLTTAETIQVVTTVMSNELLGIAKYAIREERHGNTDKPGDWA